MTTRPDTPRSVRIDAHPGHATIRVDGVPLDGVIGYQLSHDIRTGLPSLILHTTTPDGAAWEGLATVAVSRQEPPGELIAQFLEQVDPKRVERAALEREEPGQGPGSYTRNLLDTLAFLARTTGDT